MRAGVNSWIYPGDFTVSRVLAESARIGYDGVEVVVGEEGRLNLFTISDVELRRIREEAGSLGLEIPSVCTGLFWRYNLAGLDERLRRKGIEAVKRGCRVAYMLGASCLLVVPGVATPAVSYEDMWRLSKESLLEAASTAEEYGVYIAVENVWNRFLYSPLEFRSFLEDVNHEYVKMYFDVGNVLFIGEPTHWIRSLANYIVCVHVKDFLLRERRFVPPLQGDVPWKRVMEALRAVGYDYFLTVEVPPYPGDPLKAAMDCKTALDIIMSY